MQVFRILHDEYQEALGRASLASFANDSSLYFRSKAALYSVDQPQLSRIYFDSARVVLEAKVRERPEEHVLHSQLGIVYAGLGRKEAAIREGQKGVELLPISKDARRGSSRIGDLAKIYVMVGEYDAAIDQLEFLLSIPSRVSGPSLRVDPIWNPLRDHPRFQTLLEREQ